MTTRITKKHATGPRDRAAKARAAKVERLILSLSPEVSILKDPHNLIVKVGDRRSFYTSLWGLLQGLEDVARRLHWGEAQMESVHELVTAERETQALLDEWLPKLYAALPQLSDFVFSDEETLRTGTGAHEALKLSAQ